MNKKADVLHENVIFIILNVVFFSVMILFIYLQGSSIHLMEEGTAKQIALIIDTSKPETVLEINLRGFFNKAEKNGISKERAVKIDNEKNIVTIKGDEDSFYEYGYFNEEVTINWKIEGDYLVLEVIE
tara:strand:- start:1802 stop:2185 length:384 start_codon:yes stop_codon:yes gene_type:complete